MGGVSAGTMDDRKNLEGLLREASTRAGHKGSVELPTAVAIEFAKLIGAAALEKQAAALKSEGLFKDRVPAAAARQLAVVVAWAAEEHLATLERLLKLKRASRAEVVRVQAVCETLVGHCADLRVEPTGLRGDRCVRLEKVLRKRAGHLPRRLDGDEDGRE